MTGFSDAEACFSINIFRSSQSKLGWKVQAIFTIGLHKKDTAILNLAHQDLGVGEARRGSILYYVKYASYIYKGKILDSILLILLAG